MTDKIESMQDLLKLHKAMMEPLERRLALLQKPRSYDTALALKVADIEDTKASLANAIKEREVVVKYWDDRIALLRARTTRQHGDLKHTRQQFGKAKVQATGENDGAKTKPKPAAKKRKPT